MTTFKHGYASRSGRHELYGAWKTMRARCNNPNFPKYKDYGARGIKVCDRWDNFANFLADVGEKPSPKHSIDRIDNNKDYEPSNVRWATPHQQGSNKRNNSETVGVIWDRRKNLWNAALRVNGQKVLHKYFKLKDDAIEARKQAEEAYML